MTVMSMPERSILVAQVCLRTWGVGCLPARVGQVSAAVAAWRLTQSSMASWLIGVPRRGGERGGPGIEEQRVDRGKAQVPGPVGVASLVFEVVEETGDQQRVEVGEVERRGCLALLRGGEQQQEPPAGEHGRSGWCGRLPRAAASAGR